MAQRPDRMVPVEKFACINWCVCEAEYKNNVGAKYALLSSSSPTMKKGISTLDRQFRQESMLSSWRVIYSKSSLLLYFISFNFIQGMFWTSENLCTILLNAIILLRKHLHCIRIARIWKQRPKHYAFIFDFGWKCKYTDTENQTKEKIWIFQRSFEFDGRKPHEK